MLIYSLICYIMYEHSDDLFLIYVYEYVYNTCLKFNSNTILPLRFTFPHLEKIGKLFDLLCYSIIILTIYPHQSDNYLMSSAMLVGN